MTVVHEGGRWTRGQCYVYTLLIFRSALILWIRVPQRLYKQIVNDYIGP